MINVCALPQVTPRLPDKKAKSSRSKRSSRGNDFKLKYKTELCRGWEQGECAFGDQCAFAHGPWELREKPPAEMKKTKPCKSFETLGYCMMGLKCQFVHTHAASVSSYVLEELPAPKPIDDIEQAKSQRRLRVFVELEKRASL